MKFVVTWMREVTATVEAPNVRVAEAIVRAELASIGNPPTIKLMSILPADPTPPNMPPTASAA